MKKRAAMLMVLCLLAVTISGCGQKADSQKAPDETTAKAEKSEWEDNSKEVEALKKLSLTAYPGRTIGEAFTGEYEVAEWKYKEEGGKKFLKCSFIRQEKEYSLTIYQDEYENVNAAEYYAGKEKQSPEEMQKFCQELFSLGETASSENSQEFPESRGGYYSNGYWAMDLKSIDNISGTVLYDGYEYAYSPTQFACKDQGGKIIDGNTLEFSGVTITWEGDSFTLTEGMDAMIMSSMAGNNHDTEHGAGKYVKSERPKEDDQEQGTGTARSIELYAGEYNDYRWFGDNPNCPENPCMISVSNVTDTAFDFRIEQWDPSSNSFNVIFNKHTAVFTGDGTTAAYFGKEYTLNFTFPDVTTIEVSGFDPTEGISYMCNGIPGHEFS